MAKLLRSCAISYLVWAGLSTASAQGFVQSSVSPKVCGGTVVTAATAVTPIAAAQAAHGFMLENDDTAEALWWSVTGVAVASGPGSFSLAPGTVTTEAGAEKFTTPPNFGTGGALSVVAATAGHKFSCMYW